MYPCTCIRIQVARPGTYIRLHVSGVNAALELSMRYTSLLTYLFTYLFHVDLTCTEVSCVHSLLSFRYGQLLHSGRRRQEYKRYLPR